MKFWPFPILRNYGERKRLTQLFTMFAESKNLRITKEDEYDICISCEYGDMKFWNKNQYYCWGFSGEFKDLEGRKFRWVGSLPSRYAVRAMRKALDGKLAETINEAKLPR